ncbi:MAG: class I SAM-dependent methyltransferase [Thermodesulfobacteriota bacterium]
MIPDPAFNIWEHSANIRDLYARRARGEEEMDAAAQAVRILGPYLEPGMTLLDAGCGSGYYYWSFQRRGWNIEYNGLDYSPTLIEIGRRWMPLAGLDPGRLRVMAIEDLDERYDAVICFNTLPWCPDFRRPLESLCRGAKRYLLLRTSLADRTVYRWEPDGYLDEGFNHLKAYWNTYAESDVISFMEEMGFETEPIVDDRTQGRMELVVGKPFFWKLLFGRRRIA